MITKTGAGVLSDVAYSVTRPVVEAAGTGLGTVIAPVTASSIKELTPDEQDALRIHYGLPPDANLVLRGGALSLAGKAIGAGLGAGLGYAVGSYNDLPVAGAVMGGLGGGLLGGLAGMAKYNEPLARRLITEQKQRRQAAADAILGIA